MAKMMRLWGALHREVTSPSCKRPSEPVGTREIVDLVTGCLHVRRKAAPTRALSGASAPTTSGLGTALWPAGPPPPQSRGHGQGHVVPCRAETPGLGGRTPLEPQSLLASISSSMEGDQASTSLRDSLEDECDQPGSRSGLPERDLLRVLLSLLAGLDSPSCPTPDIIVFLVRTEDLPPKETQAQTRGWAAHMFAETGQGSA